MRRFSDRSHLQTVTELNVTPLLDLAFVLLIIFMITTPLIENTLDLVVPTSSTAKGEVDPDDVRIISVDRNGVVKLNEETFSLDELETRMIALRAERPGTAVVIRPDKDLDVQRFIDVMDVLQRANVTKVGVLTQQEIEPADD